MRAPSAAWPPAHVPPAMRHSAVITYLRIRFRYFVAVVHDASMPTPTQRWFWSCGSRGIATALLCFDHLHLASHKSLEALLLVCQLAALRLQRQHGAVCISDLAPAPSCAPGVTTWCACILCCVAIIGITVCSISAHLLGRELDRPMLSAESAQQCDACLCSDRQLEANNGAAPHMASSRRGGCIQQSTGRQQGVG